MNQYELQNAAEKVDGYYFTPFRPNDSREAEFLRAQAECAQHMRRATENIEALTFEQFCSSTKRKI